MNALRHGLCARVVLLPGEDRSAYGLFALRLADELKPKGFIQQILVGRIAALTWALSRLPDAADDLVERGSSQRFEEWAAKSGVTQRLWLAAHNRARAPKPEGAEPDPLFLHCPEDAQRELSRAYENGNPPPEPLTPGNVIAEAILGEHGLDAVLKLDDHERRLWSALQSTLRSLERRQKIDGCADDDDDDDDAPAPSDPVPTGPPGVDTASPPLAVSPTEARAEACSPGCETASGEPAAAERPTPDDDDDMRECETPPARNELISPDDTAAPAHAEAPTRPTDPAAEPLTGAAPDAHPAGAERTHFTPDDNPGSARYDAAAAPDRGHASQRGDPP
jgi:hypothetical protein